MKKILWFLLAFVFTAALGKVISSTWQTTQYFQANGHEATLTIGKRYNASRWSSPLPIKKIHAYTAVMEPNHEVLIETDQDLDENSKCFIRYFLRDREAKVRDMSLLPLVGSIRLKAEADGTPVKLADTDLFDRAVTKAMGPMGDGYYERPKPVAEAAPSHVKPTVPFIIAGSHDNTLEIVWNNSTTGERLIVLFWGIGIAMLFINGWVTPFNPNRLATHERKDFVHPSMRRVEPSKQEAPSAKITYTPKPENFEYPPEPPPVEPPPPKLVRQTIPAPASTKAEPIKPASISTATTSPFNPPPADPGKEPTLKLKRKPKED